MRHGPARRRRSEKRKLIQIHLLMRSKNTILIETLENKKRVKEGEKKKEEEEEALYHFFFVA